MLKDNSLFTGKSQFLEKQKQQAKTKNEKNLREAKKNIRDARKQQKKRKKNDHNFSEEYFKDILNGKEADTSFMCLCREKKAALELLANFEVVCSFSNDDKRHLIYSNSSKQICQ